MIDSKELKKEFDELYNYMASSSKVENMALFGSVAKNMMYNLIDNKPSEAQEYIDKLKSMKWRNYLTDKEADEIVEKMDPKPVWSKSQYLNAVEGLGIETCEEPYYNENALWVTASMEFSDSGQRIAKMYGMTLADAASNKNFIESVTGFALDKLKDKDKVFDIREYFDV